MPYQCAHAAGMQAQIQGPQMEPGNSVCGQESTTSTLVAGRGSWIPLCCFLLAGSALPISWYKPQELVRSTGLTRRHGRAVAMLLGRVRAAEAGCHYLGYSKLATAL